MTSPLDRGVTLRPIQPQDEDFLRLVYAGTRTDELALTNWDDAQKQAFLQMQFDAQHRYYTEYYPFAQFQVIQLGDRPIGRLYVNRSAGYIHIIDIALLPDYRNAGIGGAILGDLLAEAAGAGKFVRIHVECFNPALRLYRRLGFSPVGERGLYLEMEWRPSSIIT